MSALPQLYILAEQYRQAAEQLADLDLPAEVVADTLESLTGEIEIKAANVAMFVRNLDGMAEQIKAAEDAMSARRKAIEKRADHVREYLKANMERVGISKIECPYFKISLRDNPASVVVDDAESIPADYMRQPDAPPPAPDKKAISEAIKAGKEVPGVHLSKSKRIEIK